MRILKCHAGRFASSIFIFEYKNLRKSTPKSKSFLQIVNFPQSPEIRNREATSDIAVLKSKCFNFHVFNETVTFLVSRPHVAVPVENCFSAKFASILRMFRTSEYSHTAKTALVLYM